MNHDERAPIFEVRLNEFGFAVTTAVRIEISSEKLLTTAGDYRLN